ncbi:uncharacterized protein EI97DRAFT_431025 [Westerdykella ornata]|uniref:Copper-fist domain-containing protein n=1 Tax=Westerdykella ornata TaxID=318751 RepID=A0A6A6JSR0_WESOR|nr:uncharacterized protein EI97DRAFT_431025 [Westerdykella ornata]KAF2278776.1 hypothetical protein EI97DRAFT_431025 [Westerdykella ornata]
MWAEINGERKKVACGPCIRGHRSSKCDHRDRVLIEVRKPGRPLSSCPHPSGSCSCERVVISYTIPKSSECACPSACPSARAQPAGSVAGASSRVQKSRHRKSIVSINPATLEKAVKASESNDADSPSLISTTPTNPSFAPSDGSRSNGASLPSSASSTPFIQPSPIRKQSQPSIIPLPEAHVPRPSTSDSQPVSECCRRKASPTDSLRQIQREPGSCCSVSTSEAVQPMEVKQSCCSGKIQGVSVNNTPALDTSQVFSQDYAQFSSFQQNGQFHNQSFSIDQNFGYNSSGHMDMAVPFGFTTPIYNHMAHTFPQPHQMAPAPMHHIGQVAGNPGPEHNCHCGDSCTCFGCAAHPKNATMIDYVRRMHELMSGTLGSFPQPTYDIPSYPHHPGYGAEANQGMAFNLPAAHFGHFGTAQAPYQVNMNGAMSGHSMHLDTTTSYHASIPQTLQHSPTRPLQYRSTMDAPQAPPLPVKTEEPASSPRIDADSPKEDDTSTLSPTSFFWQEVTLPGCNDETGTCQCGDGCECVGCLTHGGHNGVSLDTAASGEQHLFNDFMAGSGDGHMTHNS